MAVTLPSLGAAVVAARRSLRRFPLVLAAGAAAAAGGVLSIEEVGPEWSHGRLVAAASLGIPLLLAVTLLGERWRSRPAVRVGLGLAAAAVLAAVFAAWPGWRDPVRVDRYTQLTVAFHLLVVLAPLALLAEAGAFWQFSRALLERLILAAAFTVTLFVGFALALAALNKLFGVDVPSNAYSRLWVVIVFVFNTWLFLGGVPEDPGALASRRDYPAVLRVFAQYALVPLVTVYLVILTVYLGKVLVTWDWPNGWIGYLVSGVSAAGILALLLVDPIRDDPEQRWIATFARQFWVAILPSIVMLWLALYQRVHQYGVTERRYFLIALSVWLAALALYYALTRSRDIRPIPASLCAVALLTFAGPWGAYSVSRASQVGRLRATLERNGMLAGGVVRRPVREVGAEDRAEISAVARYLIETHGTESIAGWFADTSARRVVLRAGTRRAEGFRATDQWADTVVTRLGVAYVERGAPGRAAQYVYTAPAAVTLPVRGFDYLLWIGGPGSTPDTGLRAIWSPRPPAVEILRARDTLLVVPLDSLLARVRSRYPRGVSGETPGLKGRVELFVVEARNARARARVDVTNLAERDSAGAGGRQVVSLAARVLVAVRR